MCLILIRSAMLLGCTILLAQQVPAAAPATFQVGIFENHGDIGVILHSGSARYDAAQKSYTISGSGDNMCFGREDFHYARTKVSGDVSLTASIAFVGQTGNNHRKAVLMIRQSLDAHSKSVDVARHGDGLMSLQYRDSDGADTHEVESNVFVLQTAWIEKRGDVIYAFVIDKDGRLQPSGAATRLPLTGSFYIGVCSHDKDVVEKAVFSKVKLTKLPPVDGKPVLLSALETVTIASTDRRVAYVAPSHFEAPNWSPDGSFLIFNQNGKIYHLALDGTDPAFVSIGLEQHVNNDHSISPDGQFIAISDQLGANQESSIYVVPIAGGTPRQIMQGSPSYCHGWSLDGKMLAFTGQREGNFDIYTIPVAGGREKCMTTAEGLDDGPDFSPDGQFIYFCSERSGSMQIWRMKDDGSDQKQVFTDESNNWFPHISPDGKWMVFLAYAKGISDRPTEKNVELRLMSMQDKRVHLLAKLFGGQGTISMPSWSPDSLKLAFVSYELLTEEGIAPK